MASVAMATDNPFHAGELKAQSLAGVGDVASRVGGFIRPFLPEQHREFYAALPFMVVAAADEQGRPWVTLLEGSEGFIASPDPESLAINARLGSQDPLDSALAAGTRVGMLGIDLATRRRNRLSGFLGAKDDGYAVAVSQSFGNCPQYIHPRYWERVAPAPEESARHSTALTEDQVRLIGASDTLFIGSGQVSDGQARADGYDASHRGGAPGFTRVTSTRSLRIPDYSGNNFFNTIGNILSNPRIALLFVDFATGRLLHVTGSATVDWAPSEAEDPAAHRFIDVAVESVVDRPLALSLRWRAIEGSARAFSIADKVVESDDVSSFYLTPVDGQRLPPYKSGQYLPIDLGTLPGGADGQRNYSLSALSNGAYYRLSVKRESRGLVSRWLHDRLLPGDVIRALPPAGDFVLPQGDDPVVLVSAGIGQTPVLAMLQELASQQPRRDAWWVHGARSGSEHAMAREVDALVATSANLRRQVFYSQPGSGDVSGQDYDAAGRLSARDLLELPVGDGAHYLVCGPAGFTAAIIDGLERAGIPEQRIRFETF